MAATGVLRKAEVIRLAAVTAAAREATADKKVVKVNSNGKAPDDALPCGFVL